MYNNHKVVICGVNTSTLKVLTEEEKQALMIRIRKGDLDARKEMICGNLRLVLSLVQRFAGRKENLDDLFQVGCIGLVKAVDNFDVSNPVLRPETISELKSILHAILVHWNRESKLGFMESLKKLFVMRIRINDLSV